MRNASVSLLLGLVFAAGCSVPRSECRPAEPSANNLSRGFCTDGSFCWQHPTPQGNTLSRLWGAAPNDLWAVGENASLIHFNGSAWQPHHIDSNVWLWGVWGGSQQ